MPTLGFLKKKRTKESPPGQSNSTSSQPTSPITPTTSRGFEESLETLSTQSTTSQKQPDPEPETPVKEEPPTVVDKEPEMAQSVAHHGQQAYPTPEPQNLPSINNLINPPQHDGAAHSTSKSLPAESESAEQKQSQPAQTVVRQTKGKYSLGDFEILRTLGTGSFGRVHLVQSKHNQRFYAVKVLKKQQVVKMKQVEHTNDERRMLQEVKHPFLITLWGTFQDSKNLYMVMDFVEGGELFSLLRKSQVRIVIQRHCLLLSDSSDSPIRSQNSMLPKSLSH
jgi:protein kinase A